MSPKRRPTITLGNCGTGDSDAGTATATNSLPH